MRCGYFAVGVYARTRSSIKERAGGPIRRGQWRRLFSRGPQRTLQTRPKEEPFIDVENTDLERRGLAHEQILQALIAHMAEAEPKFRPARANIRETSYIGRWRPVGPCEPF
jgi:hypothetical protein